MYVHMVELYFNYNVRNMGKYTLESIYYDIL